LLFKTAYGLADRKAKFLEEIGVAADVRYGASYGKSCLLFIEVQDSAKLVIYGNIKDLRNFGNKPKKIKSSRKNKGTPLFFRLLLTRVRLELERSMTHETASAHFIWSVMLDAGASYDASYDQLYDDL
jgi:hypothetical protein